MALTRESIQTSRDIIERVKAHQIKFESGLEYALNALQGDSNYQTFVEGTDIGKQNDERLKKLIDMLKSLSENEYTKIVKYTESYLDQQETLNKG